MSTESKALIQYKGMPLTITFQDVKQLICPMATDQEVGVFLRVCQSLNLNPFASEIYLIKYSERDKAATVIAIDAYLKAAEANPNYDGHEAGIILQDYAEKGGKLEFREGAYLSENERGKLAGGWAKVYRKNKRYPYYIAVNKKECIHYRRDGALTEFWIEEKQPTMLRKVALSRALSEAFPGLFAGSQANVEMEMPEGELPAAYIKNGEADWAKFWVRQKEKGLDEDEVHKIMGVSSLKEDWLEKGFTLEQAEDIINDALKKAARLEFPHPDDGLLQAWEIVKSKVKGLRLQEAQLAKWFRVGYGIEVSLADFEQEKPPEKFTPAMLSKFVDSLLLYEERG